MLTRSSQGTGVSTLHDEDGKKERKDGLLEKKTELSFFLEGIIVYIKNPGKESTRNLLKLRS